MLPQESATDGAHSALAAPRARGNGNGQTLDDHTVTVRYRDSRTQPGVPIPDLAPFITEMLANAQSAWI